MVDNTETKANRITEVQEKAKARARQSSPIANAAHQTDAISDEEQAIIEELNSRLKYFSGESIDISRREELLAKAIQVNTKIQEKGNVFSKRKSLNNLKSIKSNIDERAIGLDDEKRKEFLSIYEQAIKQTENNISLTSDLGKSFKDTVKKNIPTADQFTSALTDENPLFGAAASFIKDLVIDRLIRVKGEKDERTAKLNAIAEEAESHAAVLETEDMKQSEILENAEERKNEKKGKAPLVERMQGVLESNLRIEDAMKKLLRVWDDSEPEESIEVLERVESKIEELNNIEKDTMEIQEKKIEKEKNISMDDRFDELESTREKNGISETKEKSKTGFLKGKDGIMGGGFLKTIGVGLLGIIGAAIGGISAGSLIESIFGDNKQYIKFWDAIFSNVIGASDAFQKYGMDSVYGFFDSIVDGFKQNSVDNREAIKSFFGEMLTSIKDSIFGLGDEMSLSNPKEMLMSVFGEDSRLGQMVGSVVGSDIASENQQRISNGIPRIGSTEIQNAQTKADQKNNTIIINNQTNNNSSSSGGGGGSPTFISSPSPRTSENTIRRSNDGDFLPAM